jgi:tripartite-type tricarboxylate transporter receptor subunit TctC
MRACKRGRQALLCSAVMALGAGPLPVAAQAYPSKPVRYIVPFPAGASPDIVGRALGDRLSRIWGHQVLVDNRSGAGGTVGAAMAAKSPPDGHTLFQCNIASSAIALSLYAKPGYDHQRDFAPISRIGMTPNVLIVHPSTPARTIKEYIALARAHPGKLSYASSAAGTSPQLAMELLKLLTRTDILHISYKGATQAVADVIGGQVPSGMTNVPALLAPLQAGRLRALAVTGPQRITQLPDVPTMQEAGLPGYDVTSWYGLCAPAATPVPILGKVHADLTAVLRMPEIKQRFTDLVIDIAPTSREEFGQFMRAETERWAQVIREAKIPMQ